MPVPSQYQYGYTPPAKQKARKASVPSALAYNPASRIAREYQAPSPAYRIAREYAPPTLTHGQQELLRNAQAFALGGGTPRTAPVFNVPGAQAWTPPVYPMRATQPTNTLTKYSTRPTENFTYVNFPRMQGPPAPTQPSGMLGYTPPLYSPTGGGGGGYGGYGGYGYGGGYGGGGGYTPEPFGNFVQPTQRQQTGGSPFAAARPMAYQGAEYAGAPRANYGAAPAQRLLPRWYRNLTSWRF